MLLIIHSAKQKIVLVSYPTNTIYYRDNQSRFNTLFLVFQSYINRSLPPQLPKNVHVAVGFFGFFALVVVVLNTFLHLLL